MALQPKKFVPLQYQNIYNSRNCYGFIAIVMNCTQIHIYNSRNCYGFIAITAPKTMKQHLQQQKLLWLYSRCLGAFFYLLIYNSRNCYGFIASRVCLRNNPRSTIVEIVMALQPLVTSYHSFRSSTIVEIVMALQPSDAG